MQTGPSRKSSTELLAWLEGATQESDWAEFYVLAEKLLNDFLAVIKALHRQPEFTEQKMLKVVFSTPWSLESGQMTSSELIPYLSLENIGTFNLAVRFDREAFKR